jgi:hypothetical protein
MTPFHVGDSARDMTYRGRPIVPSQLMGLHAQHAGLAHTDRTARQQTAHPSIHPSLPPKCYLHNNQQRPRRGGVWAMRDALASTPLQTSTRPAQHLNKKNASAAPILPLSRLAHLCSPNAIQGGPFCGLHVISGGCDAHMSCIVFVAESQAVGVLCGQLVLGGLFVS